MGFRKIYVFFLFALHISIPLFAWGTENIDPARDGSKYAWGENVGWINFRPIFGPGVTVSGSAISGYAWGENIGWINLSPSTGGVFNDTKGILSGSAWGENVGWINFAPSGGGVNIDACGDFNGEAWGENIGWIRFRSSGPNPFKVTTSWISPVDTIAPVTTLGAPLLEWYNAGPTFSISSTDCGSGTAHLYYAVDDGVLVDTAGSSASATITGQGIHTLGFYSKDTAGNIESKTEVTVRIDTTPPEIVLTTPAESAVLLINRNVPADFNVTDTLSGLANVSSTVPLGGPISTSAVGTYTFNVSATDVAGNSSSVTHMYTVSFPGNIEPDRHFAWGENVGWINFRPPRGPGVTVTDTVLIGYAWAENIGWIHFNPPQGGVVNARGVLSGAAWGENVGWINFAYNGRGVTIDPATGVFLGYAWGENIGWIKFSSSGAVPGVKTSWRPPNREPVAENQSVTTNEDTLKAITLTATDPDNDPLTYTVVVPPAHGSLSGTAPNVTYTPPANYNGPDSFTFKVNDGTGDSNTATVSITVNPVNDAPEANGQSVTTNEDTLKVVTLTATDPDNDPLTYTVVVPPAHGSLSGTAPNVTYTPPANYNGPDSFTFKVNDGTGDSNTATVSITVNPVNDAPVISSLLGQTLNEGGTYTASGSFTDPDPDSWSASVNYGDGTASQPLALAGKNFTLGHIYKDNGTYTVTVSVNDMTGGVGSATASVTVNNVPPTVGQVTGPVAPIPVRTNAQIQAPFTDPGTQDTHSATASWDDGTTGACTISESNGSGTTTCNHSYSIPGVYTVTVTVTDKDGGMGTATYEYIVAYDPSGGFVTGGGWINSPVGAYIPSPDLSGKATFGFVSKYKSGATVPTGNTEFQFHVANFKFESSAYEWLVIAGARAQFKGTGTVNGSGNYGFLLTVLDGQISGGGGVDKFRIKIWNRAADSVIYDNQTGADDNSNLTTSISGGSIVIHK